MFQDNPTFSVVNFAIAAYLFYIWYSDYRANCRAGGKIRAKSLSGATPVGVVYVIFGALASLALLAVHTISEYSAGLAAEQTKVSAWAFLSWTAAAFLEELIFRGYLVIEGRGKLLLVASIVFFSLVFALCHPFMWDYTVSSDSGIFGGTWTFDFSAQPMLSTLAIFECSILFYALRFLPANRNSSLIPCITAHLAYNWGVFAVKAAQGFIV